MIQKINCSFEKPVVQFPPRNCTNSWIRYHPIHSCNVLIHIPRTFPYFHPIDALTRKRKLFLTRFSQRNWNPNDSSQKQDFSKKSLKPLKIWEIGLVEDSEEDIWCGEMAVWEESKLPNVQNLKEFKANKHGLLSRMQRNHSSNFQLTEEDHLSKNSNSVNSNEIELSLNESSRMKVTVEKLISSKEVMDAEDLILKLNSNPTAEIENETENQFINEIENLNNYGQKFDNFSNILSEKRKVAKLALTESLKAAKLGQTFSLTMTANLPKFVDDIIVKAVAIKKEKEYEKTSFSKRCMIYIQRTDVPSFARWLKHLKFTLIQTCKLIDTSEGDVASIKPHIEWFRSMKVKGSQFGSILVKHDQILKMNVDDLQARMDYLVSVGLREEWKNFIIVKSPSILSQPMDELIEKVKLFQSILGSDPTSLSLVFYNCPPLLDRLSISELKDKISFLHAMGVSETDLKRIFRLQPRLFFCDLNQKWKKMVLYFQLLGISSSQFSIMIVRFPPLICMDLNKQIMVKIRFLKIIGMDEKDISHIIFSYPRVLGCDIDKKMRPLVKYLLGELYVKEKDLSKILCACPDLFTLNLNFYIKFNMKYLIAIGLLPDELAVMVAKFPPLLKYKTDVLRPKWKFLKQVMGLGLEELVAFPRYFSYALDSRIKVRYRILVRNELVFSLRYMLSCNDKLFEERIQNALMRKNNGQGFVQGSETPIEGDGEGIGLESDGEPEEIDSEGEEEGVDLESDMEGEELGLGLGKDEELGIGRLRT